MKSFNQFISESVNIAGNFNGNLYMNGFVQDAAGKLQTAAQIIDSQIQGADANAQVFSGSLGSVQVETEVEQVGINQVVSVEFHRGSGCELS